MPISDFTPTVSEVASRIGARTLTPHGKRVGDFNNETFPTADSVAELIEDAVSITASAIGEEIEQAYWPMAKSAAIAYTCMTIESGYYPETTNQADSAFVAFRQRFQEQVKFIEDALNQKRPNERRIVSLRQETLVGIRGGRLDPWANELFPVVIFPAILAALHFLH